jgi:Tfp pilus assembly protein PilO
MIDQIVNQANPRIIPIIFISAIILTSLASYLYLFKNPLINLANLENSINEFKSNHDDTGTLENEILKTESEIAILKKELNGTDTNLHAKQLVSHVIKQLDQISKDLNVTLIGVTPGEEKDILMFEETPFHIEISGNYHDLYHWLVNVKSILNPLIVKEFEIMTHNSTEESRIMRLTISSFRQNKNPS